MSVETIEHDVLVIGAGAAGLRAALECRAHALSTGVLSKSLLGKAHTVAVTEGLAAAMANVESRDDWQAHLRDTVRCGQRRNDWRMAELHARQAPDRVRELQEWGAVFARTHDGLIAQRAADGHRHARLAHAGERTGLEVLRTLQDHAVDQDLALQMECIALELLRDGERIAGVLALWRASGRFVVFRAKAVILATGGMASSADCTGDGLALAYAAGAELADLHLVGGIRVDADSQQTAVPGLFACGECTGGLHGADRLAGNSLSGALVFGKLAGAGATDYVRGLAMPALDAEAVAAATARATEILERGKGANPYLLRASLQQATSLADVERLAQQAATLTAPGTPTYNPGWHEALAVRGMVVVAEALTRSALAREDAQQVIVKRGAIGMELATRARPEPPAELRAIVEAE